MFLLGKFMSLLANNNMLKTKRNDRILLMAVLIPLYFLVRGCSPCMAQEINDKQATLAIIGEAEDQGYVGMLAVACTLRNRGTLKGVFGLSSPRVRKHLYSNEIYQMAKMAWEESAKLDVTHGATHFESDRFPLPYWAKSMKVTFKHKNHIFYKES
jgi:hypothetical protein